MSTAESPNEKQVAQAESRVRDLITLSARLSEILEEENAALREHEYDRVASLLEEKTKLSRAYESRIKGLREQADLLAETDEEILEMLRAQGEVVTSLIEENAMRLQTSIEARKMFMANLAEAVKTTDPAKGVGYSTSGSYGTSGRTGPSRNLSVSLDRSF